MKIGVYQSHPQFGKKEENVKQAIRDMETGGADLIVLPELFNTGYQFVSREEAMDMAEKLPSGRTCETMIEFARLKEMLIIFGIAERDKDKVYNSAAVVGSRGFIGRYRKSHLFFEEKNFFDQGDTGFQVFDTGKVRLGVMICFDWWFPEAARSLALMGADIICHPANLVLPDCQRSMITRSLENGVFSATANRIGTEARGGKKPLNFTGESQILDNSGNILRRMEKDRTGLSVVEIEVDKSRDKSITSLNDRFRDRRPELYGELFK